jgi:pimeloyl-ACP methyl ester carboxylesterase/DNA-binding CsgD family transcriptional regulator
MSLSEENTHILIDLIYDAAVEPDKWPELLYALAEFVDVLGDSAVITKVISDEVADAKLQERVSLLGMLKAVPAISDTPAQIVSLVDVELPLASQYLLRHFQRALKVAKKLIDVEEERLAVCSLLDRLPVALLLVNQDAKVLEHNALADRLINESAMMGVESGRLHGVDAVSTKKLRTAIAQLSDSAMSHAESQSMVLPARNSQEQELLLYLTSVVQRESTASPVVALFISSREFQPISIPSSFSERYALTPKEITITAELVRGQSIIDIAKQSGSSESTVRTQVKSVMAKTDTKRQAELVSLVLTGPGSLLQAMHRQDYATDNEVGTLTSTANHRSPQFLQLADGRRMCFQEYGDLEGLPVIFCHSATGCRLELAIDAAELCAQKGVRLIIPDRPGIGGSDPLDEHGFLDWAEDLNALLDSLGVTQCYMSGYALGGIYAMACAYALPERVKHVSVISIGLPPESKEDYAAFQPLYRIVNRLARDLPKVHRVLLSIMRRSMLRNPDKFFSMLMEKLAPGDVKILIDLGGKELIYAAYVEAFKQGSASVAVGIENGVSRKGWGFEVDKITVPLEMWHGEKDTHIPFSMGVKMRNKIGNAEMHVRPELGHFMYYSEWPNILQKIIAFEKSDR